MPRRSILSALERNSLLALPDNQDDLIRYYSFSEQDLSIIVQHRGAANRLGFAIQLCYMRYPGIILPPDEPPDQSLLRIVCSQLQIDHQAWERYAERAETRREHLLELQSVFGFKTFTMRHYRSAMHGLEELAWQTDKGILLASVLIQNLRNQLILFPSVNVIERICAEAITRATRRIYISLTESLSPEQKQQLDALLNFRENSKATILSWLRQSPSAPNAKHMLEHLERLKTIEALMLPIGIE